MITIVDPGANPWFLAAIAVAVVLVAIAAFRRRAIFALAGCLIVGLLVGATLVERDLAWERAAIAALEVQGFTNVHLDGHEFTAADPLGLFFEGKLQHDRGNDWFLLEFTRGLI